jgi:hypothetical protein
VPLTHCKEAAFPRLPVFQRRPDDCAAALVTVWISTGSRWVVGLGLADAGHEPGHDPLLAIAAAAEVMFRDCFLSKGGSLRSGLPILAWQRHPFTNDCSARRVFGSHKQTLLWFISVEACAMQD